MTIEYEIRIWNRADHKQKSQEKIRFELMANKFDQKATTATA